ncbi:MAG TPA: FtsX-like permease family protein, partial [Polyangiaceae bacterium]|nr:FtsX-like permease family protein [Polyangiaceae bacterium]
WRNLARNRFRVVLTTLGTAIAIVAFMLLRTVTNAWEGGAEFAAKDRVVTRHKVTFVMSLPKRYYTDILAAPHVKEATFASWFGGKDPKHDHEFFSTLAVDPDTYFAVYSELDVPPEQLDAWKHDRQGAIVGDVLAKKLGWKVGDRVTLESGIYPGEWAFTVDSIYHTTARSMDRSTLLFHWAYLNDSLPATRRDEVGWITSRVDTPGASADVGVALDRVFDDRDTQTRSQDERSFNASFLAMFSAVLKAMDIVSAVILVIMTLILGNTIAMGVRERTGEYGVLRAIGFLPSHVALWVVAESLVLGAVGGLVGVGLALPFINLVIGRFIEENMGSFFPYFRLVPANMLLAIGLSALLGGAAAVIPAWRASQLRVVDAVRRVA